jgi:hypothetical protein
MPTTLHPPRSLPVRELVVPLLSVLAVAVMPLLVWSRLPDPVAIHWSLDGRPDGSAPLVVDAVLLAVVTALVTLLPLLAVGRADRRTARTMLALSHGMGVFFILLRWSTIDRNLDVMVWTDAGAIGLLDLVVMFVIASPSALLGWWLGGRHPDLPRPVRDVPNVTLPSDGRLLWTGRQGSQVARLLGPALLALGGGFTALRIAAETLVVGGTLMLVGLALWWFTSIAVSVGPAGMKVRFGPLGWPRIHVPLEAIVGIEVEDVEPLAFGGWGYRVVPGARAVVIRRGVGLRVRRSGQPDLVVTVDDAATAAGVLAAHVAQHREGEGERGSTGQV